MAVREAVEGQRLADTLLEQLSGKAPEIIKRMPESPRSTGRLSSAPRRSHPDTDTDDRLRWEGAATPRPWAVRMFNSAQTPCGGPPILQWLPVIARSRMAGGAKEMTVGPQLPETVIRADATSSAEALNWAVRSLAIRANGEIL